MLKKEQGTVGMLRVAHIYQLLGYNVLLPFGDSQRYDLAIEKKGKFERVQVKTITERNGVIQADARVIGHNLNRFNVYHPSAKDFDILAVVEMKTQNVYAVPFDGKQSRIQLRIAETKNNQKKNVRLAVDYLLTGL